MNMLVQKKAPLFLVFRHLKLASAMSEDKLANAKEIEISDLKFNIKEKNMKEDEEFKAIIAEFKQKKDDALKTIDPD